jgi:hypothetical protein
MKKFLKNYLDDLLLTCGAGLVVAAAAQVSLGLALFTAGLEMIIFGVLIGMGGKVK